MPPLSYQRSEYTIETVKVARQLIWPFEDSRYVTSSSMCSIDWGLLSGFIAAIGTLGLCAVAIVALLVAGGQLDALITQTRDARNLALVDRTMSILHGDKATSLRDFVGLVDADGPDENRAAFTAVYEQLSASSIGFRPLDSAQAALWDGIEELFIARQGRRPRSNAERLDELRDAMHDTTNFFELLLALIRRQVVEGDLILENLDYFVLAAYYAMEPTLRDLSQTKGYDFDASRDLALKAQERYAKRAARNQALATATFTPFFGTA